ncbi:MAG: zinc ABC transporter solute-binding protein [Alphaproteobacteria bacterium]|nr:zinc ABC transporter solute-binding protein [Alphaproteobacteria bacterium]
MHSIKIFLLASFIFITGINVVLAEITVITSIKPVHSLVSAVMKGIGSPSLLIDGADTPHTYSLRPSQARQLQDADLVFWIGPELETFLEKPIEAIASDALIVELLKTDGLIKHKYRQRENFDVHSHDEHDNHETHHDDHDEHETHQDETHYEGKLDPHIWLDPLNAAILISEITSVLSDLDPENKHIYDNNAELFLAKLDTLMTEVNEQLNDVQGGGFIVLHDAHQYFEERFGIFAVGSIMLHPEILPGADHLKNLQNKVKSLEAACVFSEPQFDPKLVSTITQNLPAGTGVLDSLGVSFANGPELYFDVINQMAISFRECLLTD